MVNKIRGLTSALAFRYRTLSLTCCMCEWICSDISYTYCHVSLFAPHMLSSEYVITLSFFTGGTWDLIWRVILFDVSRFAVRLLGDESWTCDDIIKTLLSESKRNTWMFFISLNLSQLDLLYLCANAHLFLRKSWLQYNFFPPERLNISNLIPFACL